MAPRVSSASLQSSNPRHQPSHRYASSSSSTSTLMTPIPQRSVSPSSRSSPDEDEDDLNTPTTPSFFFSSASSSGSATPSDEDQDGARRLGPPSVGATRKEKDKERIRGELILEDDGDSDLGGINDSARNWGQEHDTWDRGWDPEAPSSFSPLPSSSSQHPNTPSSTLSNLSLLVLRSSLSGTSLSVPHALSLLASSTSHPLLLPPIFLVVIAGLSCANHIVIVYLSRYLDVKRIEDLTKGLPGCHGGKNKAVARMLVGLAGLGLMVMHLGVMADSILPLVATFLPPDGFFQSPLLWKLLIGLLAFPFLLPSRLIDRTTTYLSILLPFPLLFIILIHSIRISKSIESLPFSTSFPSAFPPSTSFGSILGSNSQGGFWSGITILTLTLSSHLTTLPNHATLPKSNQLSFPIVPLSSTLLHLAFLLPLSLTPYYLLANPSTPTMTLPPNILDIIPESSPSSRIIGRLLAFLLTACSLSTIFIPTRGITLRFFAATRLRPLSSYTLNASWPFFHPNPDQRHSSRRPLLSSQATTNRPSLVPSTLLLYLPILSLSLLPSPIRTLLLPLTTSLTILITYLLPSLLFILLFHLRRPLSIIFPPTPNPASDPPPPPSTPMMPPSTPRFTPTATLNVNANANDTLLAMKERELQRRRTGRRLWQDGVVFFGSLPVGLTVVVWTLGRAFRLW